MDRIDNFSKSSCEACWVNRDPLPSIVCVQSKTRQMALWVENSPVVNLSPGRDICFCYCCIIYDLSLPQDIKKKGTKQQHGRKPNSYDSTQLTENITSYDKSDVSAMLTSTGLTVTILKAWS